MLTDEQLAAVEQLSGCNYSPEKIALYLDVDKDWFVKQWFDKNSQIRHFYDRGQLVSEFNINQKQKELAESGNITAAQIFLKEKETLRINNLRNQILFGDEY